jgi:hypothetical protein
MHTWKWLLMAALFSLAVGALAADVTMADLVAGKEAPAVIKLGTFDDTWQQFSLQKNEADLLLSMVTMPAAGALQDGQGTYYTQGKTATCGGETYLIAYRTKPVEVNFASYVQRMSSGEPEPVKPTFLTADTDVTLCLLNQRTMGSLLDLHPAHMPKTLVDEVTRRTTWEKEEAARVSKESQSNLEAIYHALQQSTAPRSGIFPMFADAESLRMTLRYSYYGISDDTFTQPGTDKVNYGVNTLIAGKKKAQIAYPDAMLVAFERVPAADGSRKALFLDGHVGTIAAANWAQVKKVSRLPVADDAPFAVAPAVP